MKTDLTATQTITLHAPVAKVWDALINPALIKKYLFGTDTVSDWKVGGPIFFRGTWEGKSYEDKGTILAFEKEKTLKYSYWSSMGGTPDLPENYVNVTFSLKPEKEDTVLTLTQDNCKTPESRDHSASNWAMVLDGLAKVVEGK